MDQRPKIWNLQILERSPSFSQHHSEMAIELSAHSKNHDLRFATYIRVEGMEKRDHTSNTGIVANYSGRGTP